MHISLIQVSSPDDESIEDRRTRVGELVLSAKGTDLVVLPELWAVGYFSFDRYAEAAEPADGRTVTDAAAWAASLACHVLAGSYIERDEEGRLFNSTVLVGPGGEVVHRYRKVHVFGYESAEAYLLAAGTSVTTSQTPFAQVGVTTCYDLRFPEIWRGLVGVGAELVCTPAAWPRERLEHWRLFTQARAVEQQLLIVACNAVGKQRGTTLGGHSRVVDPWGRVLLEADDTEGLWTVEADPATVPATRSAFPVLNDRFDSFQPVGLHVATARKDAS